MNSPQVLQGIAQVTAAFAEHGIAKNNKNESQGFKFRGIDDVLNRMSRHLVEANLVITPKVLSREVMERTNSRGNAIFYVVLTVEYTIHSIVDGTSVTVVTVGEAMDSGDKATNKALSIAYKYMAFQTFSIPIAEDPDKEVHEVRAKKLNPVDPPFDMDPPKLMGENEVEVISKLLVESGTDAEKMCTAYGVSAVADIPLSKFAEIQNRLQSKIKSKKEA